MTENETTIKEMTNGLMAVVSHYPNGIFVELSRELYKYEEHNDGSPEFKEATQQKVTQLVTNLFGLIKSVSNERTGNQP